MCDERMPVRNLHFFIKPCDRMPVCDTMYYVSYSEYVHIKRVTACTLSDRFYAGVSCFKRNTTYIEKRESLWEQEGLSQAESILMTAKT